LTQLRPTTRVARGATYLFIQGFASAIISLVYFVVLARMFSNVEMGVFALLSFILNLLPILGTFALPSATVKYMAQYLAEGLSEKAKSLITRLLQIWIFASLIVFVGFFFPAEALSKFILGRPDHALLFRLLAFCATFTMLHMLMVSCLQGMQRIKDVAIINFVFLALQSFMGIFFLLAGLRPRLLAVILGWLIGIIISSIVGLFLTLKYLGFVSRPHPLRPLINFSYPLYVSNVIFFVSTWVDRLLIFSYVSAILGSTKAQELLGIYHVAVRASMIPMLFSTAIIMALFPQLSELYAQQGLNSLKDAFRVSLRYLALVGFPMVVGLATLSKPLILIFAGQNYVEATLPLTIICFAALPSTLGVAIGPILLTLERTKVVSVITVVSILFNTFASYGALALAYPELGLSGPALARTFSAIIAFGLSVFALKGIFSLDFDKEVLWKAALSSLFMAIMILLLDLARQTVMSSSSQLFDIGLFSLFLYIIVGGTTYFFCLVALKTIKRYDIEMLYDYLPKGFKWIARVINDLARPS
jgi:O-antigen/teichoic acid export membrane protein